MIYTLTMAETHKLLFFPGCYDHVKLKIFFKTSLPSWPRKPKQEVDTVLAVSDTEHTVPSLREERKTLVDNCTQMVETDDPNTMVVSSWLI